MRTRMINIGFGRLGKPGGKPATVPQPKLYDFTNGKRPTIPTEERSDLPRETPQGKGSGLPEPDLIDGRARARRG